MKGRGGIENGRGRGSEKLGEGGKQLWQLLEGHHLHHVGETRGEDQAVGEGADQDLGLDHIR